MKRTVSLLLVIILAVSVLSLSACQKKPEADTATEAVSSVSDDLTPFSVNEDGSPTSYYKNEYDDENRVIRNYTYDATGKPVSSIGYEYDENGNSIKDIMYNANGEVTGQTLYEKTAEGLVTKRTDLNSKGETTSVITTEYTDFGAESAVYKYDGSDNLLSWRSYEYDDEDQLIKMTVYDANGEVESYITYTDNDDGTFTEQKYDGDGNLISTK
ncbi:MAG: hypothetical protein IJV48_06045 [Ruminococcus sp.]|nr:hypothetical protein [Ruminococcus sp.]